MCVRRADPRNAPREDRRYVADQVAADTESAFHSVICGTQTPADAAASLGIGSCQRAAFVRSVREAESVYARLADLLTGLERVLLATQVPPFNTSFDRHHAVGTRDEDREFLHTGSIPPKLAVREFDVFATLSGHSHTFGYDAGPGEDGQPHYLNLGYRGMGTVSVTASRGEFTVTRA